ncbi:MAG: SGNH/GDSL hydrolase family protein [Pararhodobacter sp.]
MLSSLPVRLLLSPVLLLQAITVRRRALALPEAEGPRAGITGRGPALSLLILGDSAAAGVGVRTQDEALAGRLVADLSRDFTLHWRLEAQSGLTSAQALVRLRGLDPGRIDVAVTVVGVNDVIRQVPPRRFRRHQRALAALLLDHGAKQVWRSGLPPMEEFPSLPRPLRHVLGAQARALDKVLAADSHGPLHRLPYDSTHADISLMAADGFHPGPAIYADWARRLAREIRQRA